MLVLVLLLLLLLLLLLQESDCRPGQCCKAAARAAQSIAPSLQL
jgi:hypothetical protein